MQTDRSGVLHYFRGKRGEKGKERDVQGADNREGNPDCVYNVSLRVPVHGEGTVGRPGGKATP